MIPRGPVHLGLVWSLCGPCRIAFPRVDAILPEARSYLSLILVFHLFVFHNCHCPRVYKAEAGMGENGEFHNISSPGWEGLGPSPAKDSKQQNERQVRVFVNGKCQSENSSAASLTSCLCFMVTVLGPRRMAAVGRRGGWALEAVGRPSGWPSEEEGMGERERDAVLRAPGRMTVSSTPERSQALNPRPMLPILSGVADLTTATTGYD